MHGVEQLELLIILFECGINPWGSTLDAFSTWALIFWSNVWAFEQSRTLSSNLQACSFLISWSWRTQTLKYSFVHLSFFSFSTSCIIIPPEAPRAWTFCDRRFFSLETLCTTFSVNSGCSRSSTKSPVVGLCWRSSSYRASWDLSDAVRTWSDRLLSVRPSLTVNQQVNYSSAVDLQIVTIRRWWKQLTLSQATLLLLWRNQWPYSSVDWAISLHLVAS